MPKNGGGKKNKGKSSPKGRSSPKGSPKKKGKGGRSPKKATVQEPTTLQEPFEEDTAATYQAAFDATVNRHFDASASGVGASGVLAVRQPDSWEHEDADDCDPLAEDDYTPVDDWEAVASTPTVLLAAAAQAPSMVSPGSDANTDEFMAYLDRDDDLREVAQPTSTASAPGGESPPAQSLEVQVLKAQLADAQRELGEVSKSVETANQKALEQKTALFKERQTTKDLRKQLEEANAHVVSSEEKAAAMRVRHSEALEQLRAEHVAAMEAELREQRSESAALREELTQLREELASERDAHAATRLQAAKSAASTGKSSERPRLKHRMAAEMEAQQQSNFPNNPPTPTGTPVGTPRDGAERASPGPTTKSSLVSEWRRKEQQHQQEQEQQQQQSGQSPGSPGKIRRTTTTTRRRMDNGRSPIATSLQEDNDETEVEAKTLPELPHGHGAASKIEMWKAREAGGGSSPLPSTAEETGDAKAKAMRAAFMKHGLNQQLDLQPASKSDADVEDDGDTPTEVTQWDSSPGVDSVPQPEPEPVPQPEPQPEPEPEPKPEVEPQPEPSSDDCRTAVMSLRDSRPDSWQSDDVEEDRATSRGQWQDAGNNRGDLTTKSPPRARTPPRHTSRANGSSRRLSTASATWSTAASTISYVSNGSFGPSRGEIHMRTAQGVSREKLERQKVLREAAHMRRQLQRRWLRYMLAAWKSTVERSKRAPRGERTGTSAGISGGGSGRRSPSKRRSRVRASTRRNVRSPPPLLGAGQDGDVVSRQDGTTPAQQDHGQQQDANGRQASELIASASWVLRARPLKEVVSRIREVHEEYGRMCSLGGFEDVALAVDASASPGRDSALTRDMLSYSAWLHATYGGFRRSTVASAVDCDTFSMLQWIVGISSRLNKLHRYYDEMYESSSASWSTVASSREDAAAHFLFDVVASGSSEYDEQRWRLQGHRTQGRKLQSITREELGWLMGTLGASNVSFTCHTLECV